MPQFYRDMEIPVVRKLARAMIVARGGNPDEMVRETGYPDAEMIPAWWKYQDQALNGYVVAIELGLTIDKSDDV